MQQLRMTAMSETELAASKERFALFSQPPPLAVGDDSPFRTKQHPRREDGKPMIEPRNFQTKPSSTGKVKSSYFQEPQSIYKGDPYVDEYMKTLKSQNDRYKTGKFHENEFKPASGFKNLASSSYKYIEQKTDASERKIIRDENGRVKTESRNVQTNPCTKVETTLLKFPKHIPDPFSRAQELEREHLKKMLGKRGEAPFRSMSHGHNLFNKHKIVYGTDAKLNEKRSSTIKYNIFNHETNFRPSNPSRGTIDRFPEYKPHGYPKPEPVKHNTSADIGGEKKDPFKPNRSSLSRPTPSITLNKVNLRRSLGR